MGADPHQTIGENIVRQFRNRLRVKGLKLSRPLTCCLPDLRATRGYEAKSLKGWWRMQPGSNLSLQPKSPITGKITGNFFQNLAVRCDSERKQMNKLKGQ
jgi:hypothetical protein